MYFQQVDCKLPFFFIHSVSLNSCSSDGALNTHSCVQSSSVGLRMGPKVSPSLVIWEERYLEYIIEHVGLQDSFLNSLEQQTGRRYCLFGL